MSAVRGEKAQGHEPSITVVTSDAGPPVTLLIVTADGSYAERASTALPEHGTIRVSVVDSGADALEALANGGVDCVLCDREIADVTGVPLLELVRVRWPDVPFLLLTGDDEDARRAAAAGVTERFSAAERRTDWDDIAAVAMAATAYRQRRDRASVEQQPSARIDGARDAVAVVRDGRYAYLNEAAVNLFQGEADSGTGPADTFLDGDLTASWFDALASGGADLRRVETYVSRPDGTRHPVTLVAAPTDWEGDPAVGLVCRPRSERREREWFQRAVEAAGHAIYVTDPDGVIEYVNPAFEDVTGYSAEEAVGRTPAILRSGQLDEEYYEALWETITAGDVWEEEVIDRRKSGEIYYAHQTIAPILDDGDIAGHVAIQTDVTERKEHEHRLAQYERAIEGSSDLIAAIDPGYRYLFANERYREHHDVPPGVDARLDEVLDEETWAAAKPRVERVLDGEDVRYTTKRSRDGESARTFDIRYYPLPGREPDTVGGAVATIRDVTERETRERQLLVLSRILRHNLHNEMNVILGQAETLADASDSDVVDRAERIVAAGQDLLDLTDKQRDVVELLSEERTPEPLPLAPMLRKPVERVREQYPAAEVSLQIPDDVSVRAIPRLSDAVSELLDNAITHSDHETPQVRVSVETTGETVTLSVADSGPGIPPAERTILTDGDDIDQLYHGSGMGLWLVHWIVSRSKGTLSFESASPSGSVVSVTLSRAPSREPTETR